MPKRTVECPIWLMTIIGTLAVPGGIALLVIAFALLPGERPSELPFDRSYYSHEFEFLERRKIERLLEQELFEEALAELDARSAPHDENTLLLRARVIAARNGLDTAIVLLRRGTEPNVDRAFVEAQLFDELGEREHARDAYGRYASRTFDFEGSTPRPWTLHGRSTARALRALERAAWISADLEQDDAARLYAERAIAVGRNLHRQGRDDCAPSRTGPWGNDVGRLVLARVYAREANHEMALAQLEWARMGSADRDSIAAVESELAQLAPPTE